MAYFSASNINGVGHLLRPVSRRKYFISLVLKESIICFDFITCFFIILNLFTPPSPQADTVPAVLGISFHDGSLVVNYPWDAMKGVPNMEYAASPDDNLFVHLGE